MAQQHSIRTIRKDHALAEPLARWHADHSNFARLLDLIEQQLGAFQAGEQADYELIRLTVYYLRHYPDRFHHPGKTWRLGGLSNAIRSCGRTSSGAYVNTP